MMSGVLHRFLISSATSHASVGTEAPRYYFFSSAPLVNPWALVPRRSLFFAFLEDGCMCLLLGGSQERRGGRGLFTLQSSSLWVRAKHWPRLLQDEESPLFMDEGNNLHYGSFDDPHLSSQDDPVEVQRENEALLRVVARTSE